MKKLQLRAASHFRQKLGFSSDVELFEDNHIIIKY